MENACRQCGDHLPCGLHVTAMRAFRRFTLTGAEADERQILLHIQ
jgi:hypothetical protein